MKRIFLLAAAAAIGSTSLAGEKAPAGTEKVNVSTEASTIEWHGEKVTGEHSGTVQLKSGFLELSGQNLTGGEFVIDMTSIKDTDIQDAETRGKLEGHLKSDDFFGVAKHPTAKLVITNVKEMPKNDKGHNAEVTGKLTIKGITNDITFPALVEVKDNVVAAHADITVDRSKYDVRYGSTSFFDGLGDKAIYDEFHLKVTLGAKK